MASVKVAVRVRPFNQRELDLRCQPVVSISNNVTSITNVKIPASVQDAAVRDRVKCFQFDHSYWSACDAQDPDYVSQDKVYSDLGTEVIQSAQEGYNVCLFAYGQTGSGKTFTMMGSKGNEGLIPRIFQNLFINMNSPDTSYRTELSYLEIYNERVFDLLKDRKHQNLKIREHPKEGPCVLGLSRKLVVNYADVQNTIDHGNNHRMTASTAMNEHSSRSHAIITVTFTQARIVDDIPSEIRSKVHLVDLAGSERADTSATSGERLKEGGSINKSLVTLGTVISTLADYSDKMPGVRKNIFIPYRDSVLTWLLKDSLGGNARTIMIATISPADCCYAESVSTLRYASRAKRIVNRPTVNEDPNVKLIRELREENARLKALLCQSVDLGAAQDLMHRNEERMRQLMERWSDKWHHLSDILQEHQSLALRREGSSVVLDSDLPYLLALDNDVLSTGMRLYHLKEGETTIGTDLSDTSQDIVLSGAFIEPEHCVISHRHGDVLLRPLDGALCSVDNVRVHEPTRLTQGAIVKLGRNHLFRFNHPLEAARLRQQMNSSGHRDSVKFQGDFQWSWSFVSVSDAAVGDDSVFDDTWLSNSDLTNYSEDSHPVSKGDQVSTWLKSSSLEQSIDSGCLDVPVRSVSAWSLKSEVDLIPTLTVTSTVGTTTVSTPLYTLPKAPGPALANTSVRTTDASVMSSAYSPTAAIGWSASMDSLHPPPSKPRSDTLDDSLSSAGDSVTLEECKARAREERQKRRASSVCRSDTGERSTQTSPSPYDGDSRNYEYGDCSSIGDLNELILTLNTDSEFDIQTDESRECSMDRQSASESWLSDDLKLPDDWSGAQFDEAVDKLGCAVRAIHSQTCEALLSKYGSVASYEGFLPVMNDRLLEDVKRVHAVFRKLEKIANNVEMRRQDDLAAFDRLMCTVSQFVQLHGEEQHAEQVLRQRDFAAVIRSLAFLQQLFAALDLEEDIEQRVVRVLETETCILREKLFFELGEAWNSVFKWALPPAKKSLTKARVATLEICSLSPDNDTDNIVVMGNLVSALVHTNRLDNCLKTLTERIVTHFAEALVKDRNTLLQVVDESVHYASVISQPLCAAAGLEPCVVRVPPAEAFQRLEQIFAFIHKPLHGVRVPVGLHEKDSVSLVRRLGAQLCKPVFECLYRDCISPALCASPGEQGADCVREVVDLTETFQQRLRQLDFVHASDVTLMDLLNNASAVFANVHSQELMRRANECLMQELLQTTSVSVDHPIGTSLQQHYNDLEKFVQNCRKQLGRITMKLPACQVSVPVRNLVCLAYSTLRSAMHCSHDSADHLCQSVHDMFSLYCDVLPTYHGERIRTLPLMAALHHNNCMFIAYHVITMDRLLYKRHPGLAVRPGQTTTVLADVVLRVRHLGDDLFTEHITTKKAQLITYLNGANSFTCIADDSGDSATRSVRHMLHHLVHVSSLWKDVLPVNIYCKAIGSLVNAALKAIIDAALSIHEFSVDDCECMVRMMSQVPGHVIAFFALPDTPGTSSSSSPGSSEVLVCEHVPCWLRYKELQLLFGAALDDIADRWASGKGPLALHFSANEVRQMVVAMFESTGKRHALLAQIK